MTEWAWERWLDGYRLADIASKMHVLEKTLLGRLERAGYHRELPPLHCPVMREERTAELTERQKDWMEDKLSQGYPMYAVSEAINYPLDWLKKMIRQKEIKDTKPPLVLPDFGGSINEIPD